MSGWGSIRGQEIVGGNGEGSSGGRRAAEGAEFDATAAATQGASEDTEPSRQEGSGHGGEGGRTKGRWYGRKLRKAKDLLVLPFRKVKKFYVRRYIGAHYYYGDDRGGCCYRCLWPPPTISPPRMTNLNNSCRRNPKPSSYEFVKFLIESNDFYSPQCSVHGDT